ncbi:MAG: hypothetical protein ACRCR2_02285 [Fusobacteriaceae bacterium]
MDENQDVDIFAMSDEEFAQWERNGSLVQQNEGAGNEPASLIGESDEEEEFNEENQASINGEGEGNSGDSQEHSGADHLDEEEQEQVNTEQEEQEEEEESEEEESDSTDYKALYEKLIGTPIKANGKEITVDTPEDAVRLMQMGMNYSKKMEQLKPVQKVIAMLENNDMLDESKLSYAIDLLNKNPQAISKLIADSELNTFDLDEEEGKKYKPTNHSVSEQDLALDNALKEISDTPTYSRTVTVLGKEWDSASRDIVKNNPAVIGLINEHIASGIFDAVQQEVEKRKMLGSLPQGISDIEAYKFVGDALYANQPAQSAPVTGQRSENGNAPVKAPIKKPSRETVVRQKKAASTPRAGRNSVSRQMEDVFSMSDDDFMKKYART